MMDRTVVKNLVGIAVVGLCVFAPILLAQHTSNAQKNLRVVRENVFYRSGQMSLEGLERTIQEYGIRTVVSFRYADDVEGTPPDIEEERFCKKHGIRYVRILPRAWEGETPDDPAPVEPSVQQFLELMRNADNHPVLAHCFRGVHRTGAFCAIYRMELEGWSNERAIQEMKDLGYDNFDTEWNIRGYLTRYRAGSK